MSDSELLAVFGEPVAPELARTLDLGGYRWKSVASAEDAAEYEPPRRSARCRSRSRMRSR